MIEHKCHGCGTPMESSEKLVGQTRNCQACNCPNRIPVMQRKGVDESLLKAIVLAMECFVVWVILRIGLNVVLGTEMDTPYIVFQVIQGCFISVFLCIAAYFYYSRKT